MVHILPLTWVFHATKHILATSEDLSLSSPDTHPRQPTASENEVVAVPGEVEPKGAEVATQHPKDVQTGELPFIHHWSISNSHFSGGTSSPPARSSFQ